MTSRIVERHPNLVFAIGVVLYLLFGFILWIALDQYVKPGTAKDLPSAKKDLLQAWGFTMAGVAGAVGIYSTWRNLQNTRFQIQLNQEGQLIERFGRSIEQLGAMTADGQRAVESRIGGVYALEGIARISPENYVLELAPIGSVAECKTDTGCSIIRGVLDLPYVKEHTLCLHSHLTSSSPYGSSFAPCYQNGT